MIRPAIIFLILMLLGAVARADVLLPLQYSGKLLSYPIGGGPSQNPLPLGIP